MLACVIRIIAFSITLVKHIIHKKSKSSNLNTKKMILCIMCVTNFISFVVKIADACIYLRLIKFINITKFHSFFQNKIF